MSAEVDCRCFCEKCEASTKETYRMKGSCPNCRASFTAVIRRGDKRPMQKDCPACGCYVWVIWGGLA